MIHTNAILVLRGIVLTQAALVCTQAVLKAETDQVGKGGVPLAADLGATGDVVRTIVIDSVRSIDADLTVPANVHLQFLPPGRLEISAGATVTINGPITAPLSRLFAGPGRATFGAENTAVPRIYPQWWGACGDGTCDDTRAIQAALNAARDMGGGEVVITKGTFKTTGTLVLWGTEQWDRRPDVLASRSITLTGVSRRSSIIHYGGDGVCLWLCTSRHDGQRNWHSAAVVRLLHLRGTDRAGIGLQVAAPANAGSTGGTAIVENTCIESFDLGMYVEHSYGSRFSHNKLRYNHTGLQLGSPDGAIGTVNGNSFRDNEISHNGGVGLRIHYGLHNLFEGGLIENNRDEGIHIERTASTETSYLTFRNIWLENNQRGKPGANLGQVYLHSTEGSAYKALGPIAFERCIFNGQGQNYHIKLGDTLGLALIHNQFSHPNDRIIHHMPGTHAQWALIHTFNEDQNKVVRGVLAGNSATSGDPARDDVQGSMFMPHVYLPANSAKKKLTSSIEADARTHSSIASASGVLTTQHTVGGGADKHSATPNICLPRGTALIGLTLCVTEPLGTDLSISLEIDGRPTPLKVTLPVGSKAKSQTFELNAYKSARDWVSGCDNQIGFVCEGDLPANAAIHIVAIWRSNHLPVF